MTSELKSQGFVFKKDAYGNERWYGKAFGVDGEVYVGTNPAIVTFTEKKNYNKAQARKRVMAYKDAFHYCPRKSINNSLKRPSALRF